MKWSKKLHSRVERHRQSEREMGELQLQLYGIVSWTNVRIKIMAKFVLMCLWKSALEQVHPFKLCVLVNAARFLLYSREININTRIRLYVRTNL